MISECEWPVVYGKECRALEALDPDVKTQIEQAAIDYLRSWTHGVYGLCPMSIRPTPLRCERPSTFWGRGPYPFLPSAPMQVLFGCAHFGSCCCGKDTTITISGPVWSIERVAIDGNDVSADSYRIDNYSLLVRMDGGEWPRSQDMDVAADQPGAFIVEYTHGRPVPDGGQRAAGLLACELAKAYMGDRSCQLPERVTSIDRQGVSMTILDGFEDLNKGVTGLWAVDSWVASVNFPRLPSTVRSVDVPKIKQRRQTWP